MRIQEELKKREIKRDTYSSGESIFYDNGEAICRDLIDYFIIDHQNKTVIKTKKIRTRTYDSRSGSCYNSDDFISGASGKSGHFKPNAYPELDEFNRMIVESMEVAINPRRLYEPKFGFDINRGREYFKQDQIDFDICMDNYIAAFYQPFHEEVDGSISNSLELLIFNPINIEKDFEMDTMPTKDNRIFKLFYTYDHSSTSNIKYSFSFYSLNYPKASKNIEWAKKEMNEMKKEPMFAINIDNEIHSLLVGLAPLPIEQSDCGKNIGYPELNEEIYKKSRGLKGWYSYPDNYKLIK